MSPYTRLGAVLGRIAAATSAVRIRGEDDARREHNGGEATDHDARIRALTARLETVADELEALL